MKKLLLAILFCTTISAAFAKGVVTVNTEKVKVDGAELTDIVVNLSCEENEVRGLYFSFTLPSSVWKLGLPTYNEDRTEGFVPTLNIENEMESVVSFMSFGGNYITGTSGEIFRFTIAVLDEDTDSFDIFAEVSYDEGVVDSYDIPVSLAYSPYDVTASDEVAVFETEPATVALSLNNTDDVAGIQFDVELPEGLAFVPDAKNKVVSYSSRVTNTLGAMENLDGNHFHYMIIDVLSTNSGIISGVAGEIMYFDVVKTGEIAEDAVITISNIKVSNIQGNDYTQAEDITIVVKDGITGLNAVAAQPAANAVFNLAGQKVAADAKGIIISNGKKLLVK